MRGSRSTWEVDTLPVAVRLGEIDTLYHQIDLSWIERAWMRVAPVAAADNVDGRTHRHDTPASAAGQKWRKCCPAPVSRTLTELSTPVSAAIAVSAATHNQSVVPRRTLRVWKPLWD